MMIFRLSPIYNDADLWTDGEQMDDVIVRAEHENMARTLAKRLGDVWNQEDIVECVSLGDDDWQYKTDGTPEILYPHIEDPDPRSEAMYLRAQAYLAENEPFNVKSLCGVIYNHLPGGQAMEMVEVGPIKDWVEEAKETGKREQLPLIAAGLRKIADELDR